MNKNVLNYNKKVVLAMLMVLSCFSVSVSNIHAAADFVAADTIKPCPRCSVAIEKAGGCNWITCICGTTFCWFCFETRSRYQQHTCADGFELIGHSEATTLQEHRISTE